MFVISDLAKVDFTAETQGTQRFFSGSFLILCALCASAVFSENSFVAIYEGVEVTTRKQQLAQILLVLLAGLFTLTIYAVIFHSP